jgi:uncharacterized protein (DUF885 family)
MKKIISGLVFFTLLFGLSCKSDDPGGDPTFKEFEEHLLDAYWNQYPSAAIFIGYGKYYEKLVIPDSASIKGSIAFSKAWLDSLGKIQLEKLDDNEKISFNIIKNQLESDLWYKSVFKPHEWDASLYNISGECDYILNQPYAPLDERLKILSQHISHAHAYYAAALHMLKQPTREHLEMSAAQNKGGLSVFGKALQDSIAKSKLTEAEKETLKQNISTTTTAIKTFVTALNARLQNQGENFRDFRIGKDLFTEKFKYDLGTDLTPQQIYETALADKSMYHQKMYLLADSLWKKYAPGERKPDDSLMLVQKILDKIQLQHAKPADFFDSLSSHVYRLKKFIIEKQLFDFDTAGTPIVVRIMPEYARGFSVASADFTPPYQKAGTTYYNIDDLTLFPAAKAEGVLREYNNFASQLLSIHEAVPGHCVQGIYNNKKSADIVRSVFQNGAMIEGWAVYTESMMVENGWGGHAAEMQMALYKLKLRELANVLVDYDLHCLQKQKADILHLLVTECFQTTAQAEEKYHRATLSQVQLCSYYTGATAILALRAEYKKKKGDNYSIKDFHETFLSFGSSPVKYIRERMLN